MLKDANAEGQQQIVKYFTTAVTADTWKQTQETINKHSKEQFDSV